MALSNVPVINVNGKSWLTFQHFLVNWFDEYGVYVQGASDHLVFANMEADSMIPQGTQPLGFYVNESAPGPGDIKIYNSEAHLNYDGFRFDGAATAITMVNDKAYANRDGALVDNTGAVTYSYCHFYASSLAVAGSTDVEWTSGTRADGGRGKHCGGYGAGGAGVSEVSGAGDVDGGRCGDDAGRGHVLREHGAADCGCGGSSGGSGDYGGVSAGADADLGVSGMGECGAGRDVALDVAHLLHEYGCARHSVHGKRDGGDVEYQQQDVDDYGDGSERQRELQPGAGTDAGDDSGIAAGADGDGEVYDVVSTPCQGPYGTGCSAYTETALLAQDLADVSGQDVKSAVYHMQLDVTRLTTDEITLSRQWMTTNLTGLPATPVYVYPGGYETTTMQGITAGVPYTGARGALKEDLGVKDTYADGFNVQNITSFGVNPSWMGLAPAVLNQKIQALVWKESVWGVPWGIFWHWNATTGAGELSATEITNLIADFKASGATIQTNTGLVNWLLGGTQETGTDGNFYYKSAGDEHDAGFPSDGEFAGGGCGTESGSGVCDRHQRSESEQLWERVGDWGARLSGVRGVWHWRKRRWIYRWNGRALLREHDGQRFQ